MVQLELCISLLENITTEGLFVVSIAFLCLYRFVSASLFTWTNSVYTLQSTLYP